MNRYVLEIEVSKAYASGDQYSSIMALLERILYVLKTDNEDGELDCAVTNRFGTAVLREKRLPVPRVVEESDESDERTL